MELPLAYYGDPILRKKTAKVTEITDEIRQLVADMIDTMNAKDGIGLAAPQVFKSLSIIVVQAPVPSEDGNKWVNGKLRVLINPKITNPSPESWEASEGCLSIPGVYGPVTRPWKITVEAMDLDGNIFIEDFIGYEARVIMHENDHINGVLFIDRVQGKQRQELEPKIREIKKKFHKK